MSVEFFNALATIDSGPTGQVLYSNASGETASWQCPAGVYFVSVLCIGGGGGSDNREGGGGGGAAWLESYPVIPGQTYLVVAGRRGESGSFDNHNGGDSYFISPAVCLGEGATARIGGSWLGDGGGRGGDGGLRAGNSGGGGGGAGGYLGNGGDGGDAVLDAQIPIGEAGQSGQGGAGGGGGGSGTPSSGDVFFGGPGGGLNVNGLEANGLGGVGGNDSSGFEGQPAGFYGFGARGRESSLQAGGAGVVVIRWGGTNRYPNPSEVI